MNSTTTWNSSSIVPDYKEDYTYDADGNILTLKRNGTTVVGKPLAMDDLAYLYNNSNNQLNHVKDAVPANNYAEDIDDQNVDNYKYDGIGNLIQDTKEGISNIDWTVYGKLKSIAKVDGKTITYQYDASGNRVVKTVAGPSGTITTYYVRDAQGNTLAVYAGNQKSEQYLFGSARLGTFNPVTGLRSYEITNHLGNVLAVVGDQKVAIPSATDPTVVDHYEAQVLNQTDAYAFGMNMPGRTFATSIPYRYGFNGKENDAETGTQDYGMRIYSASLGRFLSIDPLTKSFPFYTPYQFAGNTPIQAIDLDGAEPLRATIKEIAYSNKDNHVVITTDVVIKVQVINMSSTINNDLDLSSIQSSLRQNFSSQFYGTHTASLPSAHKLNLNTKNPEIVQIYNQLYTFKVNSVIVQTEVVNSTKELTNDAIVIGIVDDLYVRKSEGRDVDPVGLTNNLNGIALLEANEVSKGKLNFERGKSLVNHELGHVFQIGHDNEPKSVMGEYISNHIQFSESQLVNMLRNALGTWNILWNKKPKGQDLKIEYKRDGDTGAQTQNFATTQEKD